MIAVLLGLLGPTADPPLVPSADDARGDLRRELLKPEYYQDNLMQRILDWIARRLQDGADYAVNVPPLQAAAGMLIAVLLIGGIVWLLTRLRMQRRTTKDKERSVLTDEVITAAQLRKRAEDALAQGRFSEALVDAFRALAVRQVERGRLEDNPGTTAHEVAVALAGEYPHQRPRVDESARLFDAVLYGDRVATREQAADVLGLDRELASVR